jgi:group I intron endonuclease
MSYKVYCHTNKTNNKRYIGITGTSVKRRWAGGAGYKTSRHFAFAIEKYGWDNFTHEVLYDGLTKEEACKIEKELIEKYKTTDDRFGYNMSTGGESGAAGVIPNKETIEKRSKKLKGRVFSEETRRKLSESAKGRTFSEETRKKMSEARKGRKLTEEQIQNLVKINTGRKMSEDAKKKISDAHEKKKIYCHETEMVYNSIHEAANILGLFPTNICAVCKGKHKHTNGYHFRYAASDEI